MTALVDYQHPDTVPIVDGQISFFIPEYDLQVTAKVKQVKGLGTADADEITLLNPYHYQILKSMMSRTKFYPHWEANDILRAVKFDMLEKNGSSYNFKEANWRRPISELLRKKILLKSRSGNRYDLVIARAENALGTGKFE